ncbi:uncharacterized protein FIBRA_09390 [Fibroporia radiculosa]|uniref:Uncharacterized protein n=1 Tax=Fibroporia radiculosa TaxID=599839 RepID=J7RHJ4_9APHY|nr:uncharacterized protein FIBRA_09390 [Fibroporia radiculosa]CCM07067.1 predicted protein [Fibroporia radiculosa]
MSTHGPTLIINASYRGDRRGDTRTAVLSTAQDTAPSLGIEKYTLAS